MPTSNVHVDASPEEHVDVVTIVPQKHHSSESVTESGISNQSTNKPSVDYSNHFDLGSKIHPIKIGTILPNDQNSQGPKLSTVICLKYMLLSNSTTSQMTVKNYSLVNYYKTSFANHQSKFIHVSCTYTCKANQI